MNIIFEMNDDEIEILQDEFEVEDEGEVGEVIEEEVKHLFEEYDLSISVQVKKR